MPSSMKRFLIGCGLTLALGAPLTALAISETVTIDSGAPQITVPNLGLSYTIESPTRGLVSFQVNDGSILFTINRGAVIQLTSSDKSSFAVSGSSCAGPTVTCTNSQSQITVGCGDPNVSDGSSLTITPGAANTCSTGGGGSQASSGGGSGGGPGPGAAPRSAPATTPTAAPSPVVQPSSTPVALARPIIKTPSRPSSNPNFIFTRLLTVGSKGEDVRQLQLKLLEQGYYPNSAKISSKFDKVTADAVKKFQKANNLAAVGYVGTGTRKALNPPPPPPPPKPAKKAVPAKVKR